MPARPPLVSVVVATNRAGEHLGEALDSVAAQTHPAVELIVVDDGSPDPDAVAAIVSRAENARLLRQPPTGVSAARNRGAGEAHGELLAFLDDDDRWHPERLARHVAAHAEDADAVASYCGIQTIDATGDRVLAPADQIAVGSSADIARRRTGILLGNLVMRRDRFVEVGGFDEGLRLAEDYDLILRLARHGRFLFVPGALVDYRAYGENSTGRHRALVASIDEVVRRHEKAARADGDDELVAALRDSARKNDRFAWWSAGRAARRALGERHPLRAVSEVWWALRTAPLGLADGVVRRLRGIRD
ncbi:glycosyltransferase family 2 protein [Microbacterium sp.]|uniref:glycosyltransferase family 2 protein n=1 Tax=Microbacterium sp. TaxID=51671 RepID=UPI002D79EC28|nr:glycosyltransferase [Microbacterium sp.]HET6300706.1 glycosyltransferase [Microbacterium sp.]